MDNKNLHNFASGISNQLNLLNQMEKNIKMDIASLIEGAVGEDAPMTFNDETSYPIFDDDTCGKESVVAVKVRHNAENKPYILFNTDCDDESEYGVKDDCWFIPEDYGTYSVYDLFGLVMDYINNHC